MLSSTGPAVASVSFGEVAKLTASNAGTGQDFGNAVAIDGDTMVVAAWKGEGAAFLTGASWLIGRRNKLAAEQAGPAKED